MGCTGIELCGKKNCLEQERCCYWPTHTVFIPRGSRKTRKNKHNKPPINERCKINSSWHCTNERACEILGKCILQHPLVLADKKAIKELRQPLGMDAIVRIITRLMPSLNKKKKKK